MDILNRDIVTRWVQFSLFNVKGENKPTLTSIKSLQIKESNTQASLKGQDKTVSELVTNLEQKLKIFTKSHVFADWCIISQKHFISWQLYDLANIHKKLIFLVCTLYAVCCQNSAPTDKKYFICYHTLF